MSQRILVAGIGNIFCGDDGFGVEVAQQLARREWPAGVRVVDFGIRGFDLAYAMIDGPAVTILVDAVSRGAAPGTLFLIEPQPEDLPAVEGPAIDSHSMTPLRVLQLVQMLGGHPGRVLVVGCEPAHLEPEDGYIGLSDAVQAAVPGAIDIIESLVETLLHPPHDAESQIKDQAGPLEPTAIGVAERQP